MDIPGSACFADQRRMRSQPTLYKSLMNGTDGEKHRNGWLLLTGIIITQDEQCYTVSDGGNSFVLQTIKTSFKSRRSVCTLKRCAERFGKEICLVKTS